MFVLREAFGHAHRDIAEILDIDEPHSRQLHSRARKHVTETRKRFTPDQDTRRRIVERFLAATLHGDVQALEQLLADDVVSWADGGGTVTAARRPVVGKDKVLRYLRGMYVRPEVTLVEPEIVDVNGAPAVLLRLGGVVAAVLAPEVDGERITAVRMIINPAKLSRLE
ncbi:hypothetical protein GCM10029964_024950 [Kibdelosporangium lantanae]